MFLPRPLYERLPLIYLGAAGVCVVASFRFGEWAVVSAALMTLCAWSVWSARRRHRAGRRELAPDDGFAYPSLESRFRAASTKRLRPPGSPDFVDTWWVWDETSGSTHQSAERDT